MPGNPTEQAGGKLLLAGGILQTLAIALHPTIDSTRAAVDVEPLTWTLLHWGYLFADTLLLAGVLLACRVFTRAGSEGWPAVALVSSGFAFTLDAVSTAIHLVNFPELTAAISASSGGAQAMFDATEAINASTGAVSFAFQFIAMAALGFSLKHVRHLAGVARMGIVIGALQFILYVPSTFGFPILPAAGLASTAIAATVSLWYLWIGGKLAGDRSMPSPSTEAGG